MLILAVAQACRPIRNLRCLLERSRTNNLEDALRAFLTDALRRPLTNAVFENAESLLEEMSVSNCQTVETSNHVDCTGTLFNVRIRNVRKSFFSNSILLTFQGTKTIFVMDKFLFKFRLQIKPNEIVLSQPPRGLRFEMATSIQPNDEDIALYMEMTRFISAFLAKRVTC